MEVSIPSGSLQNDDESAEIGRSVVVGLIETICIAGLSVVDVEEVVDGGMLF